MAYQYSENIWSVFACPECGSSLRNENSGALCEKCNFLYQHTEEGALDLRLRGEKIYPFEFHIGKNIYKRNKSECVSFLPKSLNPEVDYGNLRIPRHLTKEIVSYFPKAVSSNSLVLDLGCGSTIHREICEHAGFEYVGMDYDSKSAPILGDAHSLPFSSSSFEFVLSLAVLEHVQSPFVMTREAWRVLKPGGRFIGTVAFLEPFHSNSYYHHSHLGTLNSLQEAGFNVVKVSPNKDWSVLVAQASMGLFPKLPKIISSSVVMPVQILHRLWWKLGAVLSGSPNELKRSLTTAGSFTFIATK